jgi:hypothetical protein
MHGAELVADLDRFIEGCASPRLRGATGPAVRRGARQPRAVTPRSAGSRSRRRRG